MEFTVHPVEDTERPEVEAFIVQAYRRAFDASPKAFAPVLVALRDARSGLIAAAGYRSAADGPLYLERYLDAPAECSLPLSGQAVVARADMVEVGHLCASQAGAGRRLSEYLALQLGSMGFRWLIATLTSELRHLYRRMGIQTHPLNDATADAAGPDAAHWGAYYKHHPKVLAAPLEQVCQAIQSRRTGL